MRGSVPWAVPEAAGHGCNTACIEIADDRNRAVLILDAGSGIVGVNPDVRDLYLFHHKPGRTDTELAAIEQSARRIFPPSHAAREGCVLTM